MKRLIQFLALLFLLSSISFGQSAPGNITAAGTTCGTTNACVVLLQGLNSGSATITLNGTFVATIQFEGTTDDNPTTNTNWYAVQGAPIGSSTAATSASTNNVWTFNTANLTGIRARASAYTSGTAAVIIRASPASASKGGVGSGGSGTVTALTCVAPLSCSPSSITTTGAVGVVGATPGYPIFDQGAIPSAIDASDIFYATSGANCGTGTSEDVACAINNALLSPNNKSNIIDARGFSGRWTNNLLPCNSQMTHGYTSDGATIYIQGYLLCSVPQWGLQRKFMLLGMGIPFSPGVSPYGPAIGECGPGSPPSANWNNGTKTCTVGGVTIPQFPDTANAQTVGIKFNIPHGDFPAGNYYPLFIYGGMGSTGNEGSGMVADSIGGEVAHIAFDLGGNDTTNDATLGAGNIGFYSTNVDVRNEWHDLVILDYGTANAVNTAGMFMDRREAYSTQAGPARFSLTNTNFSSGLTAPSASTYGLYYEGANLTIEFTQGTCASKPSAYATAANSAGVTTYIITNNGGSSCTATPPTCTSIQAAHTLTLVGNTISNATNSTSSCTPTVSGGVVTALSFGTGSGYNVAIVGTGPYALTNLSMTGNSQAYQDFIVLDGTANPVTQAIHGETGSGYTIHVGPHAYVIGGVFNGTDATSSMGGAVKLDLAADGTQQMESVDYISQTPSPAIVDSSYATQGGASTTVNGFVAIYGPGQGVEPAQLNSNLGATAETFTFANDTSTGTTLARAVKITSTGAIIAANTDTAIDGIAVAGAGKSGNVQIAWGGQASCSFDNAVTEGDFVQVTSAGQCHDVGSTFPTSGSVIVGRVTTTNASTGSYFIAINLMPPASATAGATTTLNNLGSVAANATISPGSDNSIDLGDLTHRWRDVFVSRALKFTNGSGTYDTDISRTAAGEVSADTTTVGNSLGTFRAACFASGSATCPGAGVLSLPAGGVIQSADTGAPSITFGASKITLNQPLNLGVTSNQLVFGTTTNLTTVTFPASSGAITVTFPNTTDTMVGRATTDTLTNKSLSENQLTGSAAAKTLTEAGAGDVVTRADVETANLTAGHVTQDTNSSNSNTSIAEIANCAGTSVGCIGFVANTVSGTAAGGGDIFRGYAGSAVAAGVLSGGTLEDEIYADGEMALGATSTHVAPGAFGGVQANATNVAVVVQGGQDATTTGATATLVLRGEDITGGSTATIAGGATTIRGGDSASTGNSQTGGAITLRGGDVTGATGTSDAAGGVTIRGGNYSGAAASGTGGALTITGGGVTGASTNLPGAEVTIAPGLGTGNAAVSHVKIQGPALSQSSGSTAQGQVTRWVTHVKAGSTTTATATNMFNVAMANNQTAGFLITVHVETTQATPHNCSTTQTFLSAVQETSGTVTQQTTAGPIATICDTGTLTLAVAFSAAAPSVLSVTPSWATIAPSAVTITIIVQNLSQQEIALL